MVVGSSPTWKQVDNRVNGTTRSPGLGINFDTKVAAFLPRLVVHNGSLYATWYESVTSGGKIRVSRYNGDDTNPNWTFIDGGTSAGLNFNGKENAVMPNAVSFGGRLVVFWSEGVSSTRTVSGTQLRARAYTGTQWIWLDGGTAAGLNIDPKLAAQAGVPVVVNVPVAGNAAGQSKLYVSFRQRSSTGVTQLRVKVYQGGSQWGNLWKVVDGGNGLNLDPTKETTGQNAGGDGNSIYCAWSEVNAAGVRQMRVARYDGSNDNAPGWERLDGGQAWGLNRNPDAETANPGLQSLNGKIFLHWNEGYLFTANEGTRRVAVWDQNLREWAWADGGGERSNVHLYDNSYTNAASFGVYAGHLLLFNMELFPSPQPALGHVVVGIEATAP